MDGEESEDYGDYVTRCICGFTHDDGYMIACDGCSVWQHVECMQVNPNNLPDKYLCEMCEPRTVDRRRARQIQLKKRDDGSDDDSPDEGKARPHLHSIPPNAMKKKKKRAKGPEVKPEVKRIKKEKIEPKKIKKKPPIGKLQHTTQQPSRTSNIQSLLTAASLLEERWQDVWSTNTSPWTDKYDPADTNRYAEPVRTFIAGHLSQLKSEAVVYSPEEYCTMEGKVPHPQCGLSEIQRRRKGVIANVGVGEDELVIEYKGKITVKHAVLSDTSPGGRSLWKHRPCPFVYLYDKISDLDLCIDARHYGNVTRFVRRSCSPNSELRHFFVGNDLHFGVYALHSISQGEEITLPFDFRYEKCDYPVECGCGQKATCLVVRSTAVKKQPQTQTQTQPQLTGVVAEEEPPSHIRSSSRQWTHVVHSEDSNSSWTSTGSRKRTRRLGQLSPTRQSSRQESRDVSSESEEEAGPDAPEKRRKSREERKTEAVWKMFEKMEASAQRRRQHLYSEGSIDSDTTSSPSALHPLPLPSQRLQKERRGSSSSRKVQMYGGKVRLSSVSSMDALSPAELSETFSPPITPGPSSHAPEAPFTSPLLQSPPSLTSPPPPPFSPRPKFEVTPYLHPKYLFANFALPRKKAILRQWESEQQRDNQPFWASGHTIPIYTVTGTNGRQRDRGCLKHRWLKRHGDELLAVSAVFCKSDAGRGSGKENQRENRKQEAKTPMPLPHKKQVLLRWQNTGDGTNKDLEPVPTSLEPPKDSRKSSISSEPPKEVLSSSCNSPLFDDFSDGEEFELSDPERERKDSCSEPRANEEAKSEGVRGGPCTPPEPEEDDDEVPSQEEEDSNLSSISDTSLLSDTAAVEKAPSPTEDTTSPPPNLSSSVSDILLSSMEPLEKAKSEVSAPHAELVSSSPAKEDESVPSSELLGSEEPEAIQPSEESRVAQMITTPPRESSLERADDEGVCEPFISMDSDVKETETELSEALVKEQLLMREESLSSGHMLLREDGSGLGHLLLREDSSGIKEQLLMREDSSGSCSPDARAISSDIPSKAPGKRKINLSEYRNRARKPAEPRKPAHDRTSPSHTSSFFTPSLLVNPSLYYTPGLTAKGLPPLMATPTTTTAAVSSVPQFEPVSPDDGEGTPTLVSMEDSSGLLGDLTQQQLPLAATRLVPAYSSTPGMLPTDPGIPQQLPLGSYIPPHAVNQYVMDTRWSGAVPVDLAQDPRRVGGELYSHQPMHPQDVPQPMGAIHTGLLPRPGAPMVQPHMIQMMPPEDPGLIHRPDYRPPRGPMPPRAPYPHHQHRTVYRPGPGGNYF